MQLRDLATRLDDRLEVEAYEAIDPSVNGLQIGDETVSVNHVVGAVDGVSASISRAVALDADLLIVHHGLFWGDHEPLTGHRYDRIKQLIDHDIALYAAHLPLDGHQTLGNAAIIGSQLGLEDQRPFPAAENPVGILGTVPSEHSSPTLEAAVADTLDIEADTVDSLGPVMETIDDVAIVTGRGTDFIEAAATAGADVMITGEGKHEAYHESTELGIQVLLAGHYNTETVGVQAVLDLLDEWGLETTFVDLPTGL